MVQDNTRLLQQRVQCDQARSMRAAAAWAARLILVLHADDLVVFPVVDLTRLRAVVELVSLLLFACEAVQRSRSGHAVAADRWVHASYLHTRNSARLR